MKIFQFLSSLKENMYNVGSLFNEILESFQEEKEKAEEIVKQKESTGKPSLDLNNMNKVIKKNYALDGWYAVEEKLYEMGVTNRARACHMIAQCRHETAEFKYDEENLNYSAKALWRVFGKRYFASEPETLEFEYKPEKIANRVYGGRMGNNKTGDGWRYRGRGWLQLTGKNNYRKIGKELGIDLVNNPDLAKEPDVAWLIAANYFRTRKVKGKNLFEYADKNDVETISVAVNGGYNGFEHRVNLSTDTCRLLNNQWSIRQLQTELADHGYDPGTIDGVDGPKTQAALKEALEKNDVKTSLELQKLWESK